MCPCKHVKKTRPSSALLRALTAVSCTVAHKRDSMVQVVPVSCAVIAVVNALAVELELGIACPGAHA